MVDETNKDETQNEEQTEITDDLPAEELKTESGPQKEEVQAQETEKDLSQDTPQDSGDSMESVMDMYEESFKRFAEGEVVTGRIISIDKDQVLIDIGYKSEGQVRIQEFIDENGNVTAKVGDAIEVMVEWWDDEDERVLLSKDKASNIKIWESIKTSYDEEGTVKGTITNRVKGGFSVDIGVPAFLPGSQADLRPIRNLDEMVGKEFDFKILKYNRKRSNIVLSRRAILEKELNERRTATLATIEEGKVIEGTVKNITEYGVFVDLGGVDGLLHITDISWGRVKHPSELFTIGDPITVKILNLDLENERVSLGMKQLAEDPWSTAAEKYAVGSRVTGKVVSLTDFGIFVELEEGIEGLVHISEISKDKIKSPMEKFKVGDVITARVMNINTEERRIGLSIKRLEIEDEQNLLSEYVNNIRPATSSFGEILRENLQEKLNED